MSQLTLPIAIAAMPLRLFLILALLPAFAAAQGMAHGKDAHAGNTAIQASSLQPAPDDRLKRREELRAALKAQGDDATASAARATSPQDRAALREQLRLQAGPVGAQQ